MDRPSLYRTTGALCNSDAPLAFDSGAVIATALPFALLLATTTISISYRTIKTLNILPYRFQQLTTLHALATEAIQISLALLGVVAICRFNCAITHLSDYQKVNPSASWTLAIFGSFVIALLHAMAVYGVDLVEGGVSLGKWRHPYGGHMFVVTRCRLAGLKQEWKRKQTQDAQKRKRETGEGNVYFVLCRRASEQQGHQTRITKRTEHDDRNSQLQERYGRLKHLDLAKVVINAGPSATPEGRKRRNSSPVSVIGQMAAAVNKIEKSATKQVQDEGVGKRKEKAKAISLMPTPPDSDPSQTSATDKQCSIWGYSLRTEVSTGANMRRQSAP